MTDNPETKTNERKFKNGLNPKKQEKLTIMTLLTPQLTKDTQLILIRKEN